MFRKLMCFAFLATLAVPIFAEDLAAIDKKAGYALLDAISQVFYDMAANAGVSDAKKEEEKFYLADAVMQIEKLLSKSIVDAKAAKEQKQIDPVFYARYVRLLSTIKLVMAPDEQGILTPVIHRELGQFIGDVLGEEFKSSGPESINQVANAIADEIINLQLHLDNLEKKEALRKAWDKKFSEAAPKKKDS